jgi:hypothetical protein
MVLFEQPLQALGLHMRIDLRGRDVGMTEQHLQAAQVGAARQHVTGEGVPQHVRRDARRIIGRAASRPGNSQRPWPASSGAAAVRAAAESGTIRSLPPLPRISSSAASPASAVRGSASSSETRIPVA